MFCKNGVHENFSKLIRKQLCWCLFFLKLQSTCTGVSFLITLQASRLQLIKKEAPTKVLSCKFCEYLWKAASVFCRSSLGCFWRCSEKHPWRCSVRKDVQRCSLKMFRETRAHNSKSKTCFNVKSSTHYFHMKAKILADFKICISVPLRYTTFCNRDFLCKIQ